MQLRRTLVLASLFSSLSAHAFNPPPAYIAKTAVEKRDWHVAQTRATAYRALPSTGRQLCLQVLAFGGFVSKLYIRQTTSSPSGYPKDTWRKLFGKAVHPQGPMAPGEVTLTREVLGRPPGTYPATMRYALANVYFPGAGFRPGLMIILHGDRGVEDVTLFLMPPEGLTGFPTEVNPFLHPFANHLQVPSRATQALAAVTFGRVVKNVLVQTVNPDFGSVILQPEPSWISHYDATPVGPFATRIAALPVTGRERLYEIFTYDGTTQGASIGSVDVVGPWVNGEHPDAWFARHLGFEPR